MNDREPEPDLLTVADPVLARALKGPDQPLHLSAAAKQGREPERTQRRPTVEADGDGATLDQ